MAWVWFTRDARTGGECSPKRQSTSPERRAPSVRMDTIVPPEEGPRDGETSRREVPGMKLKETCRAVRVSGGGQRESWSLTTYWFHFIIEMIWWTGLAP